MFQHKGVTANNNAETFNFKMSSKKKISRHPNTHILVDVTRESFIESCDDAVGNPNIRKDQQRFKERFKE